MLNGKVAAILYEVADLLELKEEAFKPRAYRKAAHEIEQMKEPIEEIATMGRLKDIPGVGDAIAEKISEIVRTGELRYLNDLRRELPQGLTDIMKVPELGPRTAMVLYRQLDVKSLAELKAAAEQHRIRDLKGFGQRSEESILRGIAVLESSKGRMPLAHAYSVGMSIVNHLRKEGFEHVSLAGSLRRMKETIGDIDVLVATADAAQVVRTFTQGPDVKEVLAAGQTKAAIRTADDTQVDLRVVEEKSFGAALQYFTGSKEHNVKLRSLAIDKGYRLNEYGLFRKDDGEAVAGRTEDEIYQALGIQIMPPEMREDRGEIEAGASSSIPRIVELKDIKGDLHTHTDRSDGEASMEVMARAAKAKGYEYVAITDHSRSLPVANGLSVERLRESVRDARRLSEELAPFRVLIGTESEIHEDGTLDYPKEVLKDLDIVVGAVHSHFKMEEREMTERILTALADDSITILAHPTGRLIGQREAYQVDMDRVMQAAKDNGVAMEINAYPDRLDMNDVNCRKASDRRITVAVDTDSHSVAHLDNMLFGVAMARRGWTVPGDVLNVKGLKDLERHLGI